MTTNATNVRFSIAKEGLPGVPEVGDVFHFIVIELTAGDTTIRAKVNQPQLDELRDVMAKVLVERNAASARMKRLHGDAGELFPVSATGHHVRPHP